MLDIEQTFDVEAFIKALAGDSDEPMSWRVIPEAKNAVARPAVLHGTFSEVEDRLCEANEGGAGVFVTVNRTDLKGAKAANIVHYRALFADLDGVGELPEMPLSPTILVKTKNGFHVYYVLSSGITEEKWKVLENSVVSYLHGADKNAKDPARVLRVPGYRHLKEEPYRIQLLVADGPVYSAREIEDAFPAAVIERQEVLYQDEGRDTNYGLAAVTGEYVRLMGTPRGKGLWNDALHTAAFKLGTLIPEQLTDDTACKHLVKACEDSGYADDHDHDELFRVIRSSLDAGKSRPRVAPVTQAVATDVTTYDFFETALEQLHKRVKSGAQPVPGPLAGLNISLGGGLPTGAVTLLGAPPGQGKSSLALSWGLGAARQGIPVLFCSLELNEMDLTSRIVTLQKRVSWIKVRHGGYMKEFVECIKMVEQLPFRAVTRVQCFSVGAMRLIVDELTQKYGRPPLVIIDYLQLLAMKAHGADKFTAMDMVSEEARDMAVLTAAPLLCISAVNRQSYNIADERTGRPDMGKAMQAAKLSGCLEYDAEVIMTISMMAPVDGYQHGWICLAKNRSGGSSENLPVKYDGLSGNFFDCSEDDVEVAARELAGGKRSDDETKILNTLRSGGQHTNIKSLADECLLSESKTRLALRRLVDGGRVRKGSQTGAYALGGDE